MIIIYNNTGTLHNTVACRHNDYRGGNRCSERYLCVGCAVPLRVTPFLQQWCLLSLFQTLSEINLF